MSDDSNWISSKEAQRRLNRGERMLRNYAKRGQLRTRVRGRTIQYHADDVSALATELPEDDRQRVPEQAIVPPGVMLDHIRELERQLSEAMAQVGYLRGQLDTQQLQLTEAKQAQRLLIDTEKRADQLQQQLDQVTGRAARRRLLNIVLAVLLAIALLGIIAAATGILPL
jgi:hypothetical protein